MAVHNISYPLYPLSTITEKGYTIKITPFFFCSVYDKIKIKTFNSKRKIVAIEHRVTSWEMTSFLMTSFFQLINFIIKPHYKFAVFC